MGDPPLCLMTLLLTLMKHTSLKWTGLSINTTLWNQSHQKCQKPYGEAVMTTLFC